MDDVRHDPLVVVGAGFAGLALARELADTGVDVTIVDRHNHHLFQPLLYQVATAELEPHSVAHPVRNVIRGHDNLRFRVGEVIAVNRDDRTVQFADGATLSYGQLVLAAGATTHTLGIDGVREHTFPLKTLADAGTLRDHVLTVLEDCAADATAPSDGAQTFVVVGAGPTGVEFAGALADLIDHVVVRDFPELDADRIRIVLVEALPEILPAYQRRSRIYARRTLQRRGVEVLTGRALAAVSPHSARLDDDTEIATETIVWTAGVRAQPFVDDLGLDQAGGGRLVVEPDLSVPGEPDTFVVGDLGGATDDDGQPYPQLAPVAIQQAEHVARQVIRRRRGETTQPFRLDAQGIMATVGRGAAVAEFPSGLRLHGSIGWLTWLGAHLLFLIGFRNRAVVLLDWCYSALTRRRAAGTIVTGERPPRRTPGDDADRRAGGCPLRRHAPTSAEPVSAVGPQSEDARTIADSGLTGAESPDRRQSGD